MRYLRVLIGSTLIISMFTGNIASQTAPVQPGEGVWYDGERNKRSRADLDTILARHEKWANKLHATVDKHRDKAETKEEVRAWILEIIHELKPLLLIDSLKQFNKDISRLKEDTTRAVLTRAILIGADLQFVNLTGANLYGAVLIEADLTKTNLTCADLRFVQFQGAELIRTDFTGALMWGTILSHAKLRDTILRNSRLSYSEMKYSIFEPLVLPEPHIIAVTRNIDNLTYNDNPGPLAALKESLYTAGFKSASKKVNAAIRRKTNNEWYEKLLFDLTCEWGSNYLRPLAILFVSFIVFGAMYGILETKIREDKEYLIANQKGLAKEFGDDQVKWKEIHNKWRGYSMAYLFSLQSTFRLGFRDFNIGHWLRMFLSPSFKLNSCGWARVVSGIQSVLSVALIILFLLSYFARPFEF